MLLLKSTDLDGLEKELMVCNYSRYQIRNLFIEGIQKEDYRIIKTLLGEVFPSGEERYLVNYAINHYNMSKGNRQEKLRYWCLKTLIEDVRIDLCIKELSEYEQLKTLMKRTVYETKKPVVIYNRLF